VMGAEAARRADLVIVTDDNPRSEDPARIRAEVIAGARGFANSTAGADGTDGTDGTGGTSRAARESEVLEIPDRRAAIRAAVHAARAGDAVVIAGKGHERGQNVGGVVHSFSDRDELTAALTELIAGAGA